jgi:hypothetical protein
LPVSKSDRCTVTVDVIRERGVQIFHHANTGEDFLAKLWKAEIARLAIGTPGRAIHSISSKKGEK